MLTYILSTTYNDGLFNILTAVVVISCTKAMIFFIALETSFKINSRQNISFIGSFIVTIFHVNISQLQFMSLSQIITETPKTRLL